MRNMMNCKYWRECECVYYTIVVNNLKKTV